MSVFRRPSVMKGSTRNKPFQRKLKPLVQTHLIQKRAPHKNSPDQSFENDSNSEQMRSHCI